MSETRTPRSIAAHQEACAKKFEAHKLSHLFLAACELERELTAERAARERAEAERDALRAEVERLRGALLLADSLCKIALPKFNWGASALDAEAIKLLNETPGAIASAIRAAKEGS